MIDNIPFPVALAIALMFALLFAGNGCQKQLPDTGPSAIQRQLEQCKLDLEVCRSASYKQ